MAVSHGHGQHMNSCMLLEISRSEKRDHPYSSSGHFKNMFRMYHLKWLEIFAPNLPSPASVETLQVQTTSDI